MNKLLGAALLSVVLVGGVVAHQGILLVDVRPADGPRVVAPVPVAVVRAGLLFAPDDVRGFPVPEAADVVPHLGRMAEELRAAPDGTTLLELTDGPQRVSVTREGDALRVWAIEGERSVVEVRLPLASLDAAVDAYDEEDRRFSTSGLLGALAAGPRGELVHVIEGNDRVRLRRLF